MQTADGEMGLPVMAATSNYFTLLGVRAYAGRLFNEGDNGREEMAAVLSHRDWLHYLGGDRSAALRALGACLL